MYIGNKPFFYNLNFFFCICFSTTQLQKTIMTAVPDIRKPNIQVVNLFVLHNVQTASVWNRTTVNVIKVTKKVKPQMSAHRSVHWAVQTVNVQLRKFVNVLTATDRMIPVNMYATRYAQNTVSTVRALHLKPVLVSMDTKAITLISILVNQFVTKSV